jgi:tight adherence protein C
MEASMLVGYGAAIATAVGLGAVVFFLVRPRRVNAAEDVSEGEAAVGPVQRSSFAATLVAAAPRGYIGWLEKQLIYAGRPIGWTIPSMFTWKVVLPVAALIFGGLFIATGPHPLRYLLVGAVVVLCFFVPDVMINSRAHDRQQRIQRELPDTLDQMTIAVEAGLGFEAAMAKAAQNGSGPISEEMIRTLQDMSIGRSRRDAYVEMEGRTNSEGLRRFIRAIVQADAYGVAIADVLRIQAAEMRTKRRQNAEEQAMKIQVKILFPLIFCLLPVLFIVILTPAVFNVVETFSGR